jgi:acyl carrier protein
MQTTNPVSAASASALLAHIEGAAYLAPGELRQAEPLFSAGIIDSLNLIDLITFTEQHFAFRVPAEDVTLDNWDSVDKIVAYVARKRGN